MRLLLDWGADADTEDKDGWTPLHLASFKGESEAVHLLLNHGASADAQEKEGRTPLQVTSG
jgi:ankyrin repeat protein